MLPHRQPAQEQSQAGGSRGKEPFRPTVPERRRKGPYVDSAATSPYTPRKARPRRARRESQEIHLSRRHVTRDSMLESMLSSFDQIAPKSLDSDESHLHHNSQPWKPQQVAHTPFQTYIDTSMTDDTNYTYTNNTQASPKGRPSKFAKDRGEQAAMAAPQSPVSPTATYVSGDYPVSSPSSQLEKTNSQRGSGLHTSVAEPGSSPLRSIKSATHSGSMLDRARPVPSDYHDFSGSQRGSILHSSRSETPEVGGMTRGSVAADNDRDLRAFISGPMAAPTNAPYDLYGGMGLSGGSPSSDRSRIHGVGAHNAADSTSRFSTVPANRSKPGFLKRVFGGGAGITTKSATHAKPEPPQLPPLGVSNKPSRQPLQPMPSNGPVQHASSAPKPPPIPVDDDIAPRLPPQDLRKKTSFFRRKKKQMPDRELSISDPGFMHSDTANATALPSPSISSLRKVMNPFLNEGEKGHSRNTSGHMSNSSSLGNVYSHGDVPLQNQITSKQQSQQQQQQTRTRRAQSASRLQSELDPATIETNESAPPVPDSSVRTGKGGPLPDSDDVSTSNRDIPPTKNPHELRRSAYSSPHLRMWAANTAMAASNARKPSLADSAVSPTHTSDPHVLSLRDEEQMSRTVSAESGSLFKANSNKSGEREFFLTQRPSMERAAALRQAASPTSSERNKAEQPTSPMDEAFQSATSLPLVQVDGDTAELEGKAPGDGPTAEDYQHAKRIFDQQNGPIEHAKAALLLGEPGAASERLRSAYMSNFDFGGVNIVSGMRDLCGRLALKGETQQVDRILDSFSQRWCECNANHGFKSPDAVHAICYSLLLLNTDLHMADVDAKMTRNQFIKNTMPAIRSIAEDKAGDQDTTIRPKAAPKRGSLPWRDDASPSPLAASSSIGQDALGARNSPSAYRAESRLTDRPLSEIPSMASPGPGDVRSMDPSALLVNSSVDGTGKVWENAVETVLKDFYISIRSERLPLHGASETRLQEQPSASSLTVGSILRRSGSVVSKNPSENAPRGRTDNLKSATSRFVSKNRSRPGFYASSTFGSSRTGSRTSIDSPNVWTPGGSSIWSKSYHAMSTDSLASRLTRYDERYQQSIGFANALSHAIIREESGNALTGVSEEDDLQLADAELEFLELAGAPWAKEGIVHHKHHLETTDKRAKDRAWAECFAVIEKGVVRLFSFSSKASMRSQKHNRPTKGAVVGGGNWTENAEAVGTFLLRQTIANVLPPPGYSKTRPHVFALSLPTGAVHLFQVGTPEIAKEFVTTANYWSARLSKEPLVGGVSNVEYGWGDAILNNPLNTLAREDTNRSVTPTSGQRKASHSVSHRPSTSLSLRDVPRPSFQGSILSTLGDTPGKRPADRTALSEWSPPQQSLMASNLTEPEQRDALKRYVLDVEQELQRHNELRGPMMTVYGGRSGNAGRAIANWERKSSYLLKEIVKYGTYVESLEAAAREGDKVKKEREEREREKEEREAAKARAKRRAEGRDDDDDDDTYIGPGLPSESMPALLRANSDVGEA